MGHKLGHKTYLLIQPSSWLIYWQDMYERDHWLCSRASNPSSGHHRPLLTHCNHCALSGLGGEVTRSDRPQGDQAKSKVNVMTQRCISGWATHAALPINQSSSTVSAPIMLPVDFIPAAQPAGAFTSSMFALN